MTFKICMIKPSGAMDLTPISPEAAAKRDLAGFLAFYEDCRRVAEKYSQMELFKTSKAGPLVSRDG